MGPIDNFFARNGVGKPPKKKSFYQKHKETILLIIFLGIIVGSIAAFALIFGIPVFLSK